MDRNNLTEAELEGILRNSRFTNEEHKKALHKRIFGERKDSFRKEQVQMALSMDELAMVAGGKAGDPGIWKEELGRMDERP